MKSHSSFASFVSAPMIMIGWLVFSADTALPQSLHNRPYDSLEGDEPFERTLRDIEKANRRTKELNEFSRWTRAAIRWADSEAEALDKLATKIDNMDPELPDYQAWVNYYDAKRAEFAAESDEASWSMRVHGEGGEEHQVQGEHWVIGHTSP